MRCGKDGHFDKEMEYDMRERIMRLMHTILLMGLYILEVIKLLIRYNVLVRE